MLDDYYHVKDFLKDSEVKVAYIVINSYRMRFL